MNTEDLVQVPRGLLGAARYAIKNKVDAPNVYAQLGEYAYQGSQREPAGLDAQHVLDEQLSTLQADRDIKAANLQLLVEKVLMWEVQDSAFQVAPELQAEFNETMTLARGLKQ
jgi:hypothetical protein